MLTASHAGGHQRSLYLREEMHLHQEMLGLVGIMDTLLAAPVSSTNVEPEYDDINKA